MKRLRIGRESLKSLARARGWRKEKIGKYEYWREADILAYENYLRRPSPLPEPKSIYNARHGGRRRGAGLRTFKD